MIINYTSRFRREYKKLPEHIKVLLKSQEQLFRQNIYHESLSTHKLKGRLNGFLAFSIDKKFRVMFTFFGEEIDFVSV
jgi:mRNA-degrading endonuclease RelE of RelBE toxin-antitoxin system